MFQATKQRSVEDGFVCCRTDHMRLAGLLLDTKAVTAAVRHCCAWAMLAGWSAGDAAW